MNLSQQKPDWLKVRLKRSPGYDRIDNYHRQQGLHTVCRSAACPNQGECWGQGTATFMILGEICTRGCRFCNIDNGFPRPVDPEEPGKVARAIGELGLKHAVITSVTRDDLADGGARQFARLTREIRRHSPDCRIELLIPDLQGDKDALDVVLRAGPDILGHNLETVPRLYAQVRQGASYARSLKVLADTKAGSPGIIVKSSLMLGMGESFAEVLAVLTDLHQAGCQILTLGQYLAPTKDHFPVARYLAIAEFGRLRKMALELGFEHVEAGPLVRSSYHAEQQFGRLRPV